MIPTNHSLRATAALLVLTAVACPAATTYIRAGQVFDGTDLLGPRTIVLHDSVIDTLLPADAPVPCTAAVVDASGQTVLPGFVTHVQLVAPPIPYMAYIERYGSGRLTVEEMSGFPAARFDLLAHGVTTAVDIGSPLPVQLGLKKALARGSIIGPRLIVGGPVFAGPGKNPINWTAVGHHDWIDLGTCRVGDVTTARRRVDEFIEQGVELIAIECNDGVGNWPAGVRLAVRFEASDHSIATASLTGYDPGPTAIERANAGRVASAGEHFFARMQDTLAHGGQLLDVLGTATSEWAEQLPGKRALGAIAGGYKADFVFYKGPVDSGDLSSERIARVMLGGRTVVENGRVPKELAYGFRRTVLDGIAYPYWDPLLSFLLGGSITDYDLFNTGTTASADMLWSTRNMWFANVSFLPPSPIPRTGLRIAAHFDNQNRLFYGLGNDAPLDSAVEYRNVIFREFVGTATRVGREWRAAGSVLFDQTRLRPYGSETLPDGLAGRDGGNELMVSLSLAHDTRDHQVNPWYGHYVGAGVLVAPAVLTNGHAFSRAFAEARGYVSVAHHHILAGRALYQQAFGDVPFYHLPEFGGDTLGRGYLPFRFRDRAAVIGQFEYRFPIWSTISGVAFVDVGQFQPGPGSFSIGGFHPAIGFGPRVCFGANESRMIGVDVGFTPEGWNLVLHNGQVF